MKIKDLREMSDRELIELKKDLEFSKVKASSIWGIGKIKDKEVGVSPKGTAKKGDKTSLQKNIRRTIAQIKTLLKENEKDN